MMPQLLLALILVSQPPNPEEAAWVTATSEQGDYSISLPEAPKEQSFTTPESMGSLRVGLMVAGKGESLYIVQWIKNKDPVQKGAEQRFLDGARDGLARNRKGKVSGERRIVLQGHPGRDFTIQGQSLFPDQTTKPATIRVRYFLVGDFTYCLSVISPLDRSPDPDVRTFFNSFALKPAAADPRPAAKSKD